MQENTLKSRTEPSREAGKKNSCPANGEWKRHYSIQIEKKEQDVSNITLVSYHSLSDSTVFSGTIE